jgi:NitT/TauT family transport system substrate-binding protein
MFVMARKPAQLFVTGALILGTGIAACAPASPPAPTSPPAPAQPTTAPAAQPTAVPTTAPAQPTPAAAAAATTAPAAAKTPQKVKFFLPFLRSIAFYPVHLAEELGYFKQEGLDITSEKTDGSSFVVQQVAAGNSPLGIATADPVLLGFDKSPNFQVVYDFLTGNVFDLYATDASKITQIADLKNKTVGVKDMSGGEVPGLRVRLEKAGLHPGQDVQIQAVGESAAAQAEALRSGRIDAFMVSWNSAVGLKQALAKENIKLQCLTCDAQSGTAAESVIASNDFIKNDQDLLIGMGRALAKATLFAETNPDAAIAIMKKVNPEEQTDPEYAKAYFADALAITKPREGKFGLASVDTWKREMDFLLLPGTQTGLEKPVDLQALINNSFVEQYNTFDHDAVMKQAKDYKP